MSHTSTIIHMRNVPGEPKLRALDAPLELINMDGSKGFISVDFKWDGSSIPWVFQGLFPRHWHPIASCRHDWRCRYATCYAERLFADQQFKIDVGTTSWWITKQVGYVGVRIGAFFGIGSRF